VTSSIVLTGYNVVKPGGGDLAKSIGECYGIGALICSGGFVYD